jgi:hypothetical protein
VITLLAGAFGATVGALGGRKKADVKLYTLATSHDPTDTQIKDIQPPPYDYKRYDNPARKLYVEVRSDGKVFASYDLGNDVEITDQILAQQVRERMIRDTEIK